MHTIIKRALATITLAAVAFGLTGCKDLDTASTPGDPVDLSQVLDPDEVREYHERQKQEDPVRIDQPAPSREDHERHNGWLREHGQREKPIPDYVDLSGVTDGN